MDRIWHGLVTICEPTEGTVLVEAYEGSLDAPPDYSRCTSGSEPTRIYMTVEGAVYPKFVELARHGDKARLLTWEGGHMLILIPDPWTKAKWRKYTEDLLALGIPKPDDLPDYEALLPEEGMTEG